jgi:hypothetical protein
MKLFVSIVATILVGVLGAASGSSAQEPVVTERVVHLPAARVGGTHHRATPVILPPPANVYERATRRDRARESSEPSTRRIRRDL